MVCAFSLTVAASNFVSPLAIFASSPVALPTAFMAAWRSSIGEAASTTDVASAMATRLEATVSTLLLNMQVSRELLTPALGPVPCTLRHRYGYYSRKAHRD